MASTFPRQPETPAATAADPLVAAAGVLLLSGLAHLLIWSIAGGSWEGGVSFRKPILFGFSAGLTAGSLAWLWGKLKARSGDQWLIRLLAAALLLEVGLITLQFWRGVPSHYNLTTSLDTAITYAIHGLIVIVTVLTGDLSIRSLGSLRGVTSDMVWAVRLGMGFLCLSCVLGFWLAAHGDAQLARGLPPGQVGAHGVGKFPHGATLHAIQLLPLIAWVGKRLGASEPTRRRAVILAGAANAAFLAYAVHQTLTGRPRFDGNWITLPWLVLAVLLAVAAGLVFVARPRRLSRARRRGTDSFSLAGLPLPRPADQLHVQDTKASKGSSNTTRNPVL